MALCFAVLLFGMPYYSRLDATVVFTVMSTTMFTVTFTIVSTAMSCYRGVPRSLAKTQPGPEGAGVRGARRKRSGAKVTEGFLACYNSLGRWGIRSSGTFPLTLWG